MISSGSNNLVERILSRISQAGKIESISRSSMIYSITTAFSDEINTAKTEMLATIRNGMIPYANRDGLESIGVGMGLPRLVNSPKVVTRSSGVIKVVYGNDSIIPDILDGKTILTTGDIIDYESFQVVIMEDVVLESGVYEIPIAASVFPKAESIDAYISAGSIYDTSIATKFSSERFSIKFSTGIVVSKVQESLEDYRARLMFAGSSSIKGSERDIILAIMSAAPMLTFSITKEDDLSLSIGIVDQAYHRTGTMPLYDQYEALVSQAAKRYSRYGVRYNIFKPEISDIKISVRFLSGSISESSFVDAFSLAYLYSGSTTLSEVAGIVATRAGLKTYEVELLSATYTDSTTMIDIPLSPEENLSNPEYCFRVLLENVTRVY